MASQNPWLTVKHGRSAYTINEWTAALTSLKLPASSRPTFTAMIGRKSKTDALRGLLPASYKIIASGHGQAFLAADLSPKAEGPMLYIDYELQTCDLPKWHDACGTGSSVSRTVDLLAHGPQPWSRRRVGNLLCGRAIAPLCDTLCYFASDCGGLRTVAAMIAELMSEDATVDAPLQCLPRVVVVVDTMSTQFNSHLTELRFMAELGDRLDNSQDIDAHVRRHFHSIHVVGSSKRAAARSKWSPLRKRLLAIKCEISAARALHGLDFRRDHLFAMTTRLIDHFCSKRPAPFSIAEASRPAGFMVDDLAKHLEELITLIPVDVWLWHLVVPLLSCSILLSSYPPGSHRKS